MSPIECKIPGGEDPIIVYPEEVKIFSVPSGRESEDGLSERFNFSVRYKTKREGSYLVLRQKGKNTKNGFEVNDSNRVYRKSRRIHLGETKFEVGGVIFKMK